MKHAYYTCDVCKSEIACGDMYSIVVSTTKQSVAEDDALRKLHIKRGGLVCEPHFSFSYHKDLCGSCAKKFYGMFGKFEKVAGVLQAEVQT